MMQPGWEWARNAIENRNKERVPVKLLQRLTKGRKPKPIERIAYKRTWTRGEGADPQIFITIETTCLPGRPLDDTSLIEMMIYLKRNGWQSVSDPS
jgi:hypothetical protein